MKKRDFNKFIRSVSTKERLDLGKLSKADEMVKRAAVHFLVRYRAPIVKDMIPNEFDWNWFRACGYLYETKGKEYTFVHTCEHKIT